MKTEDKQKLCGLLKKIGIDEREEIVICTSDKKIASFLASRPINIYDHHYSDTWGTRDEEYTHSILIFSKIGEYLTEVKVGDNARYSDGSRDSSDGESIKKVIKKVSNNHPALIMHTQYENGCCVSRGLYPLTEDTKALFKSAQGKSSIEELLGKKEERLKREAEAERIRDEQEWRSEWAKCGF